MLARGFGRIGRPGLFGMAARTAVVAGTATAVSGGMRRRQDQRGQQQAQAAAYEQQQAQAAAPPVAAPPANATDQLVARLKELGDLKDRGILTDEEFQTQKAYALTNQQ